MSEALVDFFSHVDQQRHVAFVCASGGEIVGDARYVVNADGKSCEFAIVVADDWHHSGIAALLMDALVQAHGPGLLRVVKRL